MTIISQKTKETRSNSKTKIEKAPIYHTFKYKGKAYLFDVRTSFSMRIDDAAYEILRLLKDNSKDEAIDKLNGRFSKKTIKEVFLAIEKLKKNGLLQPQREESSQEIDALIRRIIRRQSPTIDLTVVQGCNMRCKYCFERYGYNRKVKSLMSQETGERAIEFLIEKSKGCKELNVTFFGGEPLINWKLIKHLVHYTTKRAKELGRQTFFSLTTNGTLVTDEVARYIKKYNFGLFCSLDGPPEIQNKLRPLAGGRCSFFKAARGIKRIMRIRRQVTVRATLNKLNCDYNQLFDFFERFGFTKFALGSAVGKSFEKGPLDFGPEDMQMLIKQGEEYIQQSLQRLKEGKPLYRNPFEGIKAIHERRRVGIRCGVGRGTTVVSTDGKLYPCHRYLGMNNYYIGDIWKGYDEQKLYDYLMDYYKVKDYCKSCWVRNLCGGPCPAYVAHKDGHHRPPDKDFLCRMTKMGFEEVIWLYEELKENFPDYFEKLINPT